MIDQLTATCQDQRRRQSVRASQLNGIDYIEIVDDRTQLDLCVHLFRKVSESLVEANVRVDGGRRIRDIRVTKVSFDPETDDCVRVTVDKPGDFSSYSLRLVEAKDGRPTDQPLGGFDPRYAKAPFSFKIGCPSHLDCKPESVCPPPTRGEPDINYLAKDYASFRQLILDRLALLVPDWRERHVPDVGIALVELLAYVGDHLSYYQDAVATEAYLQTARQRISVRRHTRLVDYHLHEGCNARAWVCVQTDVDLVDPSIKLRDVYFTAGSSDGRPTIFEPLLEDLKATLKLYQAHTTIRFYTWGDEQCWLPRGSMQATLRDTWLPDKKQSASQLPLQKDSVQQSKHPTPAPPTAAPSNPKRALQLSKGDVLIFEQVLGTQTGNPADADPTRRWAVRLTKVAPSEDPLAEPEHPELPVPIVEIEWAAEDALPFDLCLSAMSPPPDCSLVHDISVARGNVILVDHGQTIDPVEPLGQVPQQTELGKCVGEGMAGDITYQLERFEPHLENVPLTFSELLSAAAPAVQMLTQDPRQALPQILRLMGVPDKKSKPDVGKESVSQDENDSFDPKRLWCPQSDLLESQSQDQHYVVEIDNDGRAHLRFGDGELGRMPEAGMRFNARYRVGNGPTGNVGADTITAFAVRNTALRGSARNPLPAHGGTAPESMVEAKLFAPQAFRKKLQRAITPADYAAIARRNAKIQAAGASLRWTGSWYEVQVALDPRDSEQVEESLRCEIERYLHPFRRMGHDLNVVAARYVPLEIELSVCVLPHYLRGHVEAALLDLFSNRVLPDGRLGFFHPDKLSFGDGVYVSKMVAAAQAIVGVESVSVTKLQRLHEGNQGERDAGILRLGPFEIAQLDNDPNFPEHGQLHLKMGGGR